ncbi:putative oxido [Cyphellophora attinorum]|uniref:Putative oxido n=1 Tax=Cyphellophora attinorum TaxID=1664694 RepID=A0A0N1HQ09_9EURO|nr:putative oxido [Phialophora attinorum]KPI39943.1 putative oxido [Phialophora attinorum]
MARILVTGSADGLGKLAAQSLVKQGHQVVVHARNEQRAKEAMEAVPEAETCLVADLSSVAEVKKMAAEANKLGRFDSVIHNAGMGYSSSAPTWTPEGYAATFAVNSLAPYILTCLMEKPDRLIYISSGLHRSGKDNMALDKLTWKNQRWNGFQAYNDTKLQNVILANAVARRWARPYSNSVDPLWQPTKMGGSGAPGDLREGIETQVWLATSDENAVKVSGRHFRLKKETRPNSAALSEKTQDAYLKACEELSGVKFPE